MPAKRKDPPAGKPLASAKREKGQSSISSFFSRAVSSAASFVATPQTTQVPDTCSAGPSAPETAAPSCEDTLRGVSDESSGAPDVQQQLPSVVMADPRFTMVDDHAAVSHSHLSAASLGGSSAPVSAPVSASARSSAASVSAASAAPVSVPDRSDSTSKSASPVFVSAAPTFKVFLVTLVTVLLDWARQSSKSASSELASVTAEVVIDILWAGMAPELIEYLDECFASEKIWDIMHIHKISRSAFGSAVGLRGVYLLTLLYEGLVEYAAYVGSAIGPGGFRKRVDEQHMDAGYRKTRKNKVLYKYWDSSLKRAEGHKDPQVKASILFNLSAQDIAKHGSVLHLTGESIFAMLLGTVFAADNNQGIIDLVLQQTTTKLSGPSNVTSFMDNVRKAMKKGYGFQVHGTNVSFPLAEEWQSTPLIRMCRNGETTVRVLERKGKDDAMFFVTNCQSIIITVPQFTKMRELGFTFDTPFAYIWLEETSIDHDECWAQVPPSVEHAEATRILFKMRFTRKDGEQVTVNLMRSASKKQPLDRLKRACQAISLLKYYKDGELGPSPGPRDFDWDKTNDSQDPGKVWMSGEPVQKKVWHCLGCQLKFNKSGLAAHLCVKKAFKGKLPPAVVSCRAACQVQDLEDLKSRESDLAWKDTME